VKGVKPRAREVVSPPLGMAMPLLLVGQDGCLSDCISQQTAVSQKTIARKQPIMVLYKTTPN